MYVALALAIMLLILWGAALWAAFTDEEPYRDEP